MYVKMNLVMLMRRGRKEEIQRDVVLVHNERKKNRDQKEEEVGGK